jgi:hypothetical protein
LRRCRLPDARTGGQGEPVGILRPLGQFSWKIREEHTVGTVSRGYVLEGIILPFVIFHDLLAFAVLNKRVGMAE